MTFTHPQNGIIIAIRLFRRRDRLEGSCSGTGLPGVAQNIDDAAGIDRV
ncbi:hypothetical protein [Rhizobium sp. R693]|nr:hypothetical protein [Rhizobium sp. R693]